MTLQTPRQCCLAQSLASDRLYSMEDSPNGTLHDCPTFLYLVNRRAAGCRRTVEVLSTCYSVSHLPSIQDHFSCEHCPASDSPPDTDRHREMRETAAWRHHGRRFAAWPEAH